jgi:hypothetical protein
VNAEPLKKTNIMTSGTNCGPRGGLTLAAPYIKLTDPSEVENLILTQKVIFIIILFLYVTPCIQVYSVL